MKRYTFETIKGFYEYSDLRLARKKAIEIAKEINDEVLVTCLNTSTYKQDWFTAFPDGRFILDKTGLSFQN